MDDYYHPFQLKRDGWVGQHLARQAQMAELVFSHFDFKRPPFDVVETFIKYRGWDTRDYQGDLSNSVHATKITARQNLDPTIDSVWSNT